MAKRELSNTLKNLKFMQRAAQKEEQPKKEEEVKPDGNFLSSPTINRKCVVLMEGDPHPGAPKGRMSFQNFNPSIDKLNEAAGLSQQESSSSPSCNQSGNFSSRENESSQNEAECSDISKQNCEPNGDLKRKQSEVMYEEQHPTKLPKSVQANQQSSNNNNNNNSKGFFRKPKGEKLDWKVLRPPKTPKKSG